MGRVGCVGPVGLLRGFVSFNVGLKIEKHRNRHSIKATNHMSRLRWTKSKFLQLWVCGLEMLDCLVLTALWFSSFLPRSDGDTCRHYDSTSLEMSAAICPDLKETRAAIMIQPHWDLTSLGTLWLLPRSTRLPLSLRSRGCNFGGCNGEPSEKCEADSASNVQFFKTSRLKNNCSNPLVNRFS